MKETGFEWVVWILPV